MLDENTYYGKLIEGVPTESSKGTPMMAITFNVTHYAGQGKWLPMEPTERRVYLALSDAAWPYSVEKLKALEFNGDFSNPQFGVEGTDLSCTHDEYQGKTREKWDIAGGGGGQVERAKDTTIRNLNAMWKAKEGTTASKPAGRPATPPKTKATAPAAEPADLGSDTANDTIPF